MSKIKFSKNIIKDEQKYKSWKIVIADDEPDIHTITKTVLSDFTYKNRPLEFISTFSGEETYEVVKNNDDIAMILLDVVMESDDAGLIVAKKIREELQNYNIQIVLRTGQPGYAPESDVVVDYAINDYKEKTELTTKKLFTTVVTALRSYKILKTLESNKKGLKQIIDSSEKLFNRQSNTLFMKGVLTQLSSILKLNHDSVLVESIGGISLEEKDKYFKVLSTSGTFDGIEDFEMLKNSVKDLIFQALEKKKNMFINNSYIGYIKIDENISNIVYIESFETLQELDKHLIEIFFKHSSIALNNIKLNDDIFTMQKSLIEALGEIVEKRYIDDPLHIKRVSTMAYLLAMKVGLSNTEANLLSMVSPMHDVGKIGISDAILLKPAKLTKDEYDAIKTHASIGHNLLYGKHKKTLDIAAMVAYEHHERWDGKGYPRGLKAKEISLFGRIISIVDVFDALANKRCYKEAWSMVDILEYFKEEKGKQFDPEITQVFLDNFEEFKNIQKM